MIRVSLRDMTLPGSLQIGILIVTVSETESAYAISLPTSSHHTSSMVDILTQWRTAS